MSVKAKPSRSKNSRHTRFGRKAGLAPGTVAYLGEDRNFPVSAELYEYNSDKLSHKAHFPTAEIQFHPESSDVFWYNVTGVHQPEKIEEIGKRLNLHPLVLEDIVHTEQRSKLDDFESYIYLVVKMISFDETEKTIHTEQLSLVISGNTLVSFIEDKGDLFDPIREHLRKGNIKLRKSQASYLVYSMLDMIVDNYFVVLEKIGDMLQDLELDLLDGVRPESLSELHRLKKELIYLRKSIWPMREVIGSLSKSDNPVVKDSYELFLRDIYDHCVMAIDTLETYRDLTSGMMDLYLNAISNRMNMVMKTLTVIATIFIPLTFIVGVYGMNFEHMPELHVWWAYPAVWVLMIAITGGMLWYFKRKEWF